MKQQKCNYFPSLWRRGRGKDLIPFPPLLLFSLSPHAQRQDILLNSNWNFRSSYQVQGDTRRVDLSHTRNAQDAFAGKINYKRGTGNYEKALYVRPEWKNKHLFLRFEGVSSVANVSINRKHIDEHRGGYGAFIFGITDLVKCGEKDSILVRTNNGEQLDIMPLVGDFSFYGGIYRNVHLLIMDETCISPLDHASPGVYLVQEAVSAQEVKVYAKVSLSDQATDGAAEFRIQVTDGSKVICKENRSIPLKQGTDIQEQLPLLIQKPRLWNGCEDLFIYQVTVSLHKNGKQVDSVTQLLGLHYYHTDPVQGFFLNGKHLPLHGICRHQDRAEVGNALRPRYHEENVALMREMGVNTIRLAHYPQATYMYDLMDRHGIVTWAEIPFVGPGGYADKGFINQLSSRENGKQQLIELTRQYYNHPSIYFWGLFSELKKVGDNPVEYIKELNVLVKQEDPTCPTTSASNQNGDLNFIIDNIAWNRYDGWYGSTPKTLATSLDRTHEKYPEIRIGISEYGVRAGVYHQQDSLRQPSASGWWHPEDWQTRYHVKNWKIIAERPLVWGTFVWNMLDFGAAHRTEGDRSGINDKGFATPDRKVKKDSYYSYRANWNKQEPMIYLAEKRCRFRYQPEQTFMAFTTAPEAELFVNGVSCGKQKADTYSTVVWKGVKLKAGENTIRVTTPGKKPLTDVVVVEYKEDGSLQ